MEAVLLVTRAGTITILANGLVAAIRGLVFVSSVISGVTACAIRLKRRILPWDQL